MPISGKSRRGFSMVELVIVVVIIGVISAIAVPRMSSASEGTRIGAVKASMKVLDTAVEVYAIEHDGLLPCHDRDRSIDSGFGKRLRGVTAADGSGTGAKFGPYLRGLPVNPYSRRATVRIDGPPAGANLAGWRFDSVTRRTQADDPIGAAITYEIAVVASGGGAGGAVAHADDALDAIDLGVTAVNGLD